MIDPVHIPSLTPSQRALLAALLAALAPYRVTGDSVFGSEAKAARILADRGLLRRGEHDRYTITEAGLQALKDQP
jgi:hypothetical protein